MKTPDFDELVGRDLPEAERERLRRVHELLVAAGPPAEVPPSLANPPLRAEGADVVPLRIPPKRRVALLVAAALTALAFGVGYLVGDRERGAQFEAAESVQLEPVARESQAVAVVQLGERQTDGNWTMVVTVAGLPHLPKGDYYELFMTKEGKRIVPCGTFNVEGGRARTTVRFSVAYDRSKYDGMSLTRYTRTGHRVRELMRA